MYHIISYLPQYRIKSFLIIFKVLVTFLSVKQIEKIHFYKEDKSLYINNIDKKNLVNIAEYAKNANRKQINLESIRNICIWSRLRINLT